MADHYAEIAAELGIDVLKDAEARDILDGIACDFECEVLEDIFSENPVAVFGCGPSLEEDVQTLIDAGFLDSFVLVAADGAVQALLERDVCPDVNVTDLDGDVESIIRANSLGCVTVVHAHGDNIESLKNVVPMLEGAFFATTQVEPTLNVRNFGGFTDGDRAVHLAVKFGAKNIVLCGMDFGEEVGRYSGRFNIEFKIKKLAWGKRILEELSEGEGVGYYNFTRNGVDVRGFEKIGVERLSSLV